MDLTRETLVKSVDFAQPRARVWAALLEAHTALEFPALELDEQAGTATFVLPDRTRRIAGKLASTFFDCGTSVTGSRADTYRLNVRIRQKLERVADDQTRVLSSIDVSARHPGVSGDAVQCSSNGKLEQQLFGMMATRLQ